MKYYTFCLILVFGFASSSQAQLRVFSCEPEWSALAMELGAGKLDIFTATNAQQDPHYIQPRPSLIAKARQADLLICTGAELESGWLPLLLRKASNGNIQPGKSGYFMAADHVELLDKAISLDRSQGDIHAQGNPHFHLSPHRVDLVARALHQRLLELDAANAADYTNAYEKFHNRWQQSINSWQQQAITLAGQSLVSYHNNWRYLADWLGLDISNQLEPKPGIPPTTEQLRQLIDKLTQIKPLAVIYASHQNPKAAQWLSSKTGVKTLKLPYTVGSNEHTENLFELYQNIITQLTGLQL
ncbi:MAG: zinc ABC transporter substrate-binding protein [Gammaproteobacteria bacterium]|nr:zinc ABC transporter substrate-binding protein [Gammaproteobacteria bacterium]